MVVLLGPGKFYGSSLPRPRIYTYIKFSSERVDPPAAVTDPLLLWAEEAHWSMGGLSFSRLRLCLQGRIEGNVERLRRFRVQQAKLHPKVSPRAGSASPPQAPVATKRRRFMDMFDSGSEEEAEVVVRKKPARKLVGEFDRVAKEMEASKTGYEAVGMKTRRMVSDEEVIKVGAMRGKRKLRKETSEDGSGSVRVSPRLSKLINDVPKPDR